jgi:hypothetical protein
MSNYLSRAQIYKRFDSEWVLLDKPKTAKNLQVLGGMVLCHSKDRDEVLSKAVELKPKRWAVLFTGKVAKGSAVIL